MKIDINKIKSYYKKKIKPQIKKLREENKDDDEGKIIYRSKTDMVMHGFLFFCISFVLISWFIPHILDKQININLFGSEIIMSMKVAFIIIATFSYLCSKVIHLQMSDYLIKREYIIKKGENKRYIIQSGLSFTIFEYHIGGDVWYELHKRFPFGIKYTRIYSNPSLKKVQTKYKELEED